jgi:hypothetical protein
MPALHQHGTGPAEAGIQVVGENNNFKDLDSCFRGMTAFPLILTQSLEQGGVGNLIMKESRLWRDLMIPIPPKAGPRGSIDSRNYYPVFQGERDPIEMWYGRAGGLPKGNQGEFGQIEKDTGQDLHPDSYPSRVAVGE